MKKNTSPESNKQQGLFKKQKNPKAKVTPLENNVMQELRKMEKEAFELLGINENDSPNIIVNSIYEYIERLPGLNNGRHDADEIENISILLAVAWGFAVCKEYRWEWNYLEIKGKIERSYYIISPEHWYCCPPFYFITKILSGNNAGLDGINDNTVLLLFNMIKTLEEKIPNKKYTVIS